MCQFKSAICLKDRVFVPDYDSHSKMLEELHIEDDFAHASKVFVRVELVPEDGDKTSDVDEWKLNVDQDVLPDWWNENDCLPRIKAAVKVWCNNHILRTGMHTVRDGIWYAWGNASVVAYKQYQCGSLRRRQCEIAKIFPNIKTSPFARQSHLYQLQRSYHSKSCEMGAKINQSMKGALL